MSSISDLVENINSSISKNYVKKSEQSSITAGLNQVKDTLEKKDEIKIIDRVIEIIKKQKISALEKRTVKSLEIKLSNIINNYIEEYEEIDNIDDIEIEKSPIEIEELLDNKIQKYNRYSTKHPMKGVTYDNTKKIYKIKIYDIDTQSKHLEKACDKVVKRVTENITEKNPRISDNNGVFIDYKINIIDKNSEIPREKPGISEKNGVFINSTIKKFPFFYKNHYFICYEYQGKILFDINHIISVLNLKPSYVSNKYNDFKNNIIFFMWTKNKFDGYILRELISEKSAYKIILSSNSDISISFKNDVSKILSKLRKNGDLIINNDKITLGNNTKKILPTIPQIDNIINKTNLIPLNYNNIKDINYICNLIKESQKFPIYNYDRQHVLYSFILPIPSDENDIIIKFGYTENIIERFGQLESEFKCKPIFISCRLIKGRSDENTFHDLLKKQYNSLVFKHDNKKELYKFHPQLLIAFKNYKSDLQKNIPNNPIISPQTKSIIEYLEKQSVDFLNNLLELNPQSDIIYLLFTNNKYAFELAMKDKDIELIKQSSLDKDKDIEILKLRIQLIESEKYSIVNKNDSNKKNKHTRKQVINLCDDL